MGTTIPAVKAALVRGRAALRATKERAAAPAKASPLADKAEREQLERYVALFNARNWDALRALMAEECRLDMISKAARRGKEVHGYFARYAAEPETRLSVGMVDGRPALLVTLKEGEPPAYFILLEWKDQHVALIRDFRYVSYIVKDAELTPSAA